VTRVDEEEKSKGGIIIPDTAKEKPQEGKVVAAGKGKTLEDGIAARKGEEIDRMGKVVKINQKDHAQGHIIPNVRTWLTLGPSGLLAKVRERAADAEDSQKDFLRAVEITLEGARDFIRRYGDLAAALQARNEYQRYSRELQEIARICSKLADGAAGSFHEAVQSLWFLFVILHMESSVEPVVSLCHPENAWPDSENKTLFSPTVSAKDFALDFHRNLSCQQCVSPSPGRLE